MDRILHIVSSPRSERSHSRRLAEAFLDEYLRTRPTLELDTLDLWTDPLPVFDADRVAAKMTVIGGATPEGDLRTAWDSIRDVFERFDAADTYVFGVPMWNGGVPWVLKHFIDTVSQPGLLFAFDPINGYRGLLKDKKAIVVYTSSVYHDGAPPQFGRDFHSTYFRDWLNFAGIDDVHEIRLQPNWPAGVSADDLAEEAVAESRKLAVSI